MDLNTGNAVVLIVITALIITWSLCTKDLKIYLFKWIAASLAMPLVPSVFHHTLGGLIYVFWPSVSVLEAHPPFFVYAWSYAIGLNIILYSAIGFITYFLLNSLKPINVNKYLYYYVFLIWILFSLAYILPLPSELIDALQRGFYSEYARIRTTDIAWYFAIASALSGIALVAYSYKHYTSWLVLLSAAIGFFYCLQVTELSIYTDAFHGYLSLKAKIFSEAPIFIYQEIIAVLFLFAAILLSLKQIPYPITIKTCLKSLGYLILAVILFLVIGALLREFSSIIIHYIAYNITDSTNSGECFVCRSRTRWDTNLKIAAYLLYATIYTIIILAILAIRKRYKHSQKIQILLSSIFILSSPTITSWPVSRFCDHYEWNFFTGCSYAVQVITPIIMSINPVNILISTIAAYCIIKLYVYICSLFTKCT